MSKNWRNQRQLPVDKVRELRKRQTVAEALLWEGVRDAQLGVKIRRQVPIKNMSYVVDLYCASAKLIIGVDGPIHATQVEADRSRQHEIEDLGYRFLRFTNTQVVDHLDRVLAIIQQVILEK